MIPQSQLKKVYQEEKKKISSENTTDRCWQIVTLFTLSLSWTQITKSLPYICRRKRHRPMIKCHRHHHTDYMFLIPENMTSVSFSYQKFIIPRTFISHKFLLGHWEKKGQNWKSFAFLFEQHDWYVIHSLTCNSI